MPEANAELLRYLRERPPIHPVRQLLADYSLWWGALSIVLSFMAVLSGLHETLGKGPGASCNVFRVFQGACAMATLTGATIFIAVGRFQAYRDLSDFQRGADPAAVMRRAELSARGRPFARALHSTHDIVAAVGIPLSCVMMVSGYASGRWGETVTGGLWILAYIARLRREKFAVETRAWKGWRDRLKAQPLLLSCFIQSWRTVPAFVNALIKGDAYQSLQFGLLGFALFFLAGSTKGGIGRYAGSIVADDTPDAAAIARILLEGRRPAA